MKKFLIGVLAAAVVAALGLAYYQRMERQRGTAIPLPPPLETPAAPEEPAGPRYPVPAPSSTAPLEDGASAEAPGAGEAPQPVPEAPLPLLNESTPVLSEALAGLFGADSVAALFNLDEIARRFVVTVDNLPNNKLPRRNLLPKRVPGAFRVAGEGEALTIAPDNAARYAPFVQLATGVDTQRLVAVYVRFYPLLQEAYAELGVPGAYFNDRLVEVIDHLLATPDVQGPLRLVRPHVFYQYADPELEALSAGQKTLLRMGDANAARIKDKLRALREALTNEPPPPGEP